MKHTSIQYLNSILRLRLFYSTKDELSNLVGLSLNHNQFKKVKEFVAKAFFSDFVTKCLQYTNNEVDLEELINQYENTSDFFLNHIKYTKHQNND